MMSRLGLGAGHIGSPDQKEDEVGKFLNQVVDAGVTLIDTARGYGLSEERIGRHLSWRRQDFVLSTKVGYGIAGHEDWTHDGILAGVGEALQRLKTDVLDIVHLHSCGLAVLQKGDVIRALQRCKAEGTVKKVAYSGENAELEWAVASGAFDSFQFSVNIADQRSIEAILPRTRAQGATVIAKRPLANAPWRFSERPVGNYAEPYWVRLREMGIDDLAARHGGWQSVALRFTAFTPGVDTSIVGTSHWGHLAENLEILAEGPLPEAVVASLQDAFRKHDRDWVGQI